MLGRHDPRDSELKEALVLTTIIASCVVTTVFVFIATGYYTAVTVKRNIRKRYIGVPAEIDDVVAPDSEFKLVEFLDGDMMKIIDPGDERMVRIISLWGVKVVTPHKRGVFKFVMTANVATGEKIKSIGFQHDMSYAEPKTLKIA
ncbi:MAG: hypothetical protein M3Q73_00970 [bacterium]|nr:hypothetical protein [bacterium]